MTDTTAATDTPAASTETPVLKVENLTVRYGAALALNNISTHVNRGKVLAVLGPNGAGKSTFARAISGLVKCASGTIEFDGKNITNKGADKIRRLDSIHMPEGRGVFPSLTVNENLRLAATTLPRSQRKAAIERGYEVFTALASRRSQTAGTLSGGEQQMVSLARSLICSPHLIIADEMSLGLAPKMVDLVFESLDKARENGASVILIEQFVHRALAFADGAIILNRGAIAWRGPASSARDEVLRTYIGGTA
jgi:branched-chain amino acid transport system ATP-binding protein